MGKGRGRRIGEGEWGRGKEGGVGEAVVEREKGKGGSRKN